MPPMPSTRPLQSSLLRDVAFRSVLTSNGLQRFAYTAMAVLLGFQVFEITRNPLDLGWLGLVEAIPGIGLVLYGGHVADRHRHRTILLVTSALFTALAAGAALASSRLPLRVEPLFVVAFLIGVVRAFEDPAAVGMEAQVVPLHKLVRATAVLATSGRVAQVVGPALGGLLWSWAGPRAPTERSRCCSQALSLPCCRCRTPCSRRCGQAGRVLWCESPKGYASYFEINFS